MIAKKGAVEPPILKLAFEVAEEEVLESSTICFKNCAVSELPARKYALRVPEIARVPTN